MWILPQQFWQISTVVYSVKRTRGLIKQYAKILPYRESEERKDQITLLHTALCYLIDPAGPRSTVLQIPLISTWQENIGFLVGVMKRITLQICGNSTNEKDKTFITMNPHGRKYCHSHTVLKQIQHVCVLNVHRVTYVIKLPATCVSLPHLSISVTQFGLLSSAQSSTRRQIRRHSVLFG